MTGRFSAGPFAAGGVAFSVETNRQELQQLIEGAFRDLRHVGGAGPETVFEALHNGSRPPFNPWAVLRDGVVCELTVADDYVLSHLLWEVTRLVFDRTASRVHLHGAALALRGRALLLVGPTHSGKSTLAAWLTHQGWGFLTDEAALVDPLTSVVHPFWRPIGMRRPGPLEAIIDQVMPAARHLTECLVPASLIGSLATATPLAGIVLISLSPGEQSHVIRLSPAQALSELTLHYPGLVEAGREGFLGLGRIAGSVPTYQMRFDGLADAEQLLRERVDAG